MKEMKELNLRPSGIDWEHEDVVMVTSAGVGRTARFGKLSGYIGSRKDVDELNLPLTKNWVMIYQGYGCRGLDINVVNPDDKENGYVSIVGLTSYACSKVNYFIEACEKMKTNPFDGVIFDDGVEMQGYNSANSFKAAKEIRIYADRKVVTVYKAEFKCGKTVCWCYSKEKMLNNNSSWGLHSNIRYAFDKDVKEKEITEIFDKQVKNGDLKLVFNDDDVKNMAVENNLKNRLVARSLGFSCVAGIKEIKDTGTMLSTDTYSYYSFPENLCKQINSFMGIDEDDNLELKEIFSTKFIQTGYSASSVKSPRDGISSINFLDAWTGISKRAKNSKTQLDFAKDIFPKVKFNEPGTASWDRIDDRYITCAYNPYEVQSYDTYEKALFVFDIKTKTRKVILQNTEKVLLTMIPSIKNCIMKYFRFENTQVWKPGVGYVNGKDIKTCFANDFTPTEIFQGTNVGWILENEKEFGSDMEFVLTSNRYGKTYKCKMSEEVNNKKAGLVALLVLATTGDKMLEQLLKSKLFKMYFTALMSKTTGDTVFLDTSIKYKEEHTHNFEFNSKAKNLKKMFGLSMNQLRTIENKIEIKLEDSYGGNRYEYLIPDLSYVVEVLELGEDGLSVVDDKTFQDVMELSKIKEAYSKLFYAIKGNNNFRNLLKPLGVKEKVNFITRHVGFISEYDDYLRMRYSLKRFQEQNPDKEIFDEKFYPEKVGKACKFIPFIKGMSDTTRSWARGIFTEADFCQFVKSKFIKDEKSVTSDDIEFMKEDGAVTGALIKMSPGQHVGYLHDELSRWFALYQDETKAAAFDVAIERVLPLEWSDKDSGLCIIAPKSPSDVKKEGSILSHCVASYVDPIINGTENIVFIRRRDMIDDPFFTMDIVDGSVRQIHCFRNGDPTEEGIDRAYTQSGLEVYNKHFDIISFLKKWAKAKKGQVKESSIKNAYGCLGAHR